VERDTHGKLHAYGPREFKAREDYLSEVQPEQFKEMRRKRHIGQAMYVAGGAAVAVPMIVGFSALIGADIGIDIDSDTAYGLLFGGAVLGLTGWVMTSSYDSYVKQEGRGLRGQLRLGPTVWFSPTGSEHVPPTIACSGRGR
jgi:hypothetical protein